MAAPSLDQMRVRLDGANLPARDARVPVMDHGFLYGDSVYETLRTYGGKVFRLEDHLRRLRNSAAGLDIPIPWTDAELAAEIEALRADLEGPDHYLRLVLSRGVSDLDYARNPQQHTRLALMGGPFQEVPGWTYERGLRAGLVSIKRNPIECLDPRLKTGNLLNPRLAHMQARARGLDEAIMANVEDYLSEASTSNLFLVMVGGVLCTPPSECGLLEGVTRSVLLELAEQDGIPISLEPIPVAALDGCEEAFLSSTTRPVGPIGELNERPLPVPGPLTARLMELFRNLAGGL